LSSATAIPPHDQSETSSTNEFNRPDHPSAAEQASGDAPEPSALTPEEEAEFRRIKDLPREVGVMLMTVGVLGLVLPGIVGTPAFLAGGLVLWPKGFGKVENWFERRFPQMHKQSLHQINRFLDDLEGRFPSNGQEL
jgi:hypothetical protein